MPTRRECLWGCMHSVSSLAAGGSSIRCGEQGGARGGVGLEGLGGERGQGWEVEGEVSGRRRVGSGLPPLRGIRERARVFEGRRCCQVNTHAG